MYYTHLSAKERGLIDHLFNYENNSISEIARILKRNKATISREIKRNKISDQYNAEDALFKSRIISIAKHQFSVNRFETFLTYFYQNFDKNYFGVSACVESAKQLKIMSPCSKTLYNWINFNVIKITSKELLRPWKRSFFKKKYSSYLAKIPNDVIPINYRPDYINKRQRHGDYEIDLVNSNKGNKASILTLVDRKTRFGHVIKVENKKMEHINIKLKELINRDNIKIRSITKDNGTEFNLLTAVTKPLGIKLYTCNPYSSCERGTNENFNGLIRRTFPKGTNFGNIDQEKLQAIIGKINKMPRKLFSYFSATNLSEAFRV